HRRHGSSSCVHVGFTPVIGRLAMRLARSNRHAGPRRGTPERSPWSRGPSRAGAHFASGRHDGRLPIHPSSAFEHARAVRANATLAPGLLGETGDTAVEDASREASVTPLTRERGLSR